MKITTRLMVVFLVVSLIPLVLTSILADVISSRSLTEQVLHQLDSVASVQKSRLESIISQNLERLALVSSRTQLRISLESYTRDPKSDYQDKMNQILIDARSSVNSFKALHVLTLDGTIVASTDPSKIGTSHSAEEFFVRGQVENSADSFFLDKNQNLGLYLSGPLRLNDQLLGVIVIDSDVDNIISLVNEYSGLGETGETVLAERDTHGNARILTPTRFDPDAALNMAVPLGDLSSPITQAFLGNEQLFVDAVDYREVRVLAASRYISQTDWGLVVKIDQAEAYTPIAELRGSFVSITFLSSIAVVLVSLLIARSITQPIVDLTNAASKISEGELSRRVEVSSMDEIGILARAFNQMAESLVQTNLELERKVKERTIHLELEVTERKRAEEAVKTYAAQLETANKELEAFSYSVSHDLRAPLRSIDGFSQAVLEDYADQLDPQGRGYLERMRAASQRMAQLIDDMLELSRITRAELRREKVDLSAMAKAIAADLKKSQPKRQAEFVIADRLVVEGDPRLMRVALENLLDNAWKFTSKHPRATIEVGVIQQDGHPAYFVRDDGAGFDMAYASKLFGAFQRLHAVADYEGTGIGLATVQRVVHRHGGRVWAEGAVEKGATFYFTLEQ